MSHSTSLFSIDRCLLLLLLLRRRRRSQSQSSESSSELGPLTSYTSQQSFSCKNSVFFGGQKQPRTSFLSFGPFVAFDAVNQYRKTVVLLTDSFKGLEVDDACVARPPYIPGSLRHQKEDEEGGVSEVVTFRC